jgi:hypothetical protein
MVKNEAREKDRPDGEACKDESSSTDEEIAKPRAMQLPGDEEGAKPAKQKAKAKGKAGTGGCVKLSGRRGARVASSAVVSSSLLSCSANTPGVGEKVGNSVAGVGSRSVVAPTVKTTGHGGGGGGGGRGRGGGGSGSGSVGAAAAVAKAEDGYFQWEAVVRGEVDGNKLSGATKILQTLNSTSETSARHKLESDIQCYHHAWRLALDRIQAVSLTQLIIDIMEFERLSGMNVPLAPCIVVCGKYVTTLVAQEKWNEAASVLRLWYQDTAEKNFSEKRPLFSAVASKCQNKEEQLQVAMGMLEAFFSNAVIDLFAEPLNSTVDKTLGHPFELAVAMLERYAGDAGRRCHGL